MHPGLIGNARAVPRRRARDAMQRDLDATSARPATTLGAIPNRRRFIDQLAQTIARCRRDARQFSLLHADLDGFRRINDALGHTTGDRVLSAVALTRPANLPLDNGDFERF